jgi:hypothetical protein
MQSSSYCRHRTDVEDKGHSGPPSAQTDARAASPPADPGHRLGPTAAARAYAATDSAMTPPINASTDDTSRMTN